MKILFDIGGTKTRVAGTTDLETFTEPVVFETPKDFDEFLFRFKDTALEVASGEAIEAVAGDFAGPFKEDKETLFRMPSIPEWGNDIAIKKKLEETLGVRVLVANDADVVGLGEAVFGGGRGADIVAYMTISTGVGGARIVNGKIDVGVYSVEPGWQIIDAGRSLCSNCSKHGFLHDYIAGKSVEEREGKKPHEILSDEYWDGIARWLAYGLYNTTVHWSPQRIVLGGSMMKEVGIHIPDVEKHLTEILEIYPKIPEIRKAELGDFGGLYGAMALLRNAQF